MERFSSYELGKWEINLARRELVLRGKLVPLGGRAFNIIEVLIQSGDGFVTKDELMSRVWTDVIVEDNTLQVHVSAVRKALGADRWMLKTITGRGYRLIGDWKGRPESEAPVTVIPAAPQGHPLLTNLPAASGDVIGRDTAVRQLRDILSAYRIVSLTGPGGIGKTTLGLEVARQVPGEFADGRWLVELASLSDPGLVPSTVTQVLQLGLGAADVSADAVARAISDRHLLIVLDTCEHLIDAVAIFVETTLRLCPHVTVLTTSRESLRTQGEYVYPVPPLAVPAPGQEVSGIHSAPELFIRRMKELGSEFAPDAPKLTAIAAICRDLDGIPLAIELAAARAAVLGIGLVAAGLHDRFTLLSRGRRTALPRHQTLRATLDWSHDLLPEAERVLLRRIAVFPAGFTLDAVSAVMADIEPDPAGVMDGIANLVAKSLVTFHRSETGSRGHLLDTTRAYALEKLRDNDEAGLAARRQAEFYLAFFSPFGTEGQLQAAIDDLWRYRLEVDNLRAALNWAFSVDGDVDLGVDLAAAAADFWPAAALMPEACLWAGNALAHIGSAAGTRSEMVLLCSLGITLTLTRGMTDEARGALTRALALAQAFADFDYQQRVTNHFWMFLVRASALDEALAMARQFEEVTGSGDTQMQMVIDFWIGITQVFRAVHGEAIERLQRVSDLYPIERRRVDTIRFAGDFHAGVSCHLAVSLLSRGLLDAASEVAVNAVDKARDANEPVLLCVALSRAAVFVFLSLGELETVGRLGDELADQASKHALRPFFAVGLCVGGSLMARRGDLDAGVDALCRGLTVMRESGYLLFYAFFLVDLAAALGTLGRIDEGLAEIEEALRFASETGHRWFLAETLRVKGELFAARDPNAPAVEACFHEGAKVAREQDALFWELRLAVSLAQLWARQARREEAIQVLAHTYKQFTSGFATADLRTARALLESLSIS